MDKSRLIVAATGAEKTAAPHPFDANRKHSVVQSGLDRDIPLAKSGCAGGAGVCHVDHRDAGFSDLMHHALAHRQARL